MPLSIFRAALLVGCSLSALATLTDPGFAKGKGLGDGAQVISNILHGGGGANNSSPGGGGGTSAGIGGGGGIAGGGGGTGVGVGSDLTQSIGRAEDNAKPGPSLGGGDGKSGRPNLLTPVHAVGPERPQTQPTTSSNSNSSQQKPGTGTADTSSGGGGSAPQYDWDPFTSYNAPAGGGGGSAPPNIQHLDLAQIAAQTADAAGQVTETNETDAGAAEASYQTAKETLAVVRETHAAIGDPQGELAQQHMVAAHKAADQARRYAEEAVRIVLKAWPQWPSLQAQSAAAYAQRAADAAQVEMAVADNMMASVKSSPNVALGKPTLATTASAATKATAASTHKDEEPEETAFATIPTPQHKPAIPVALKQEEAPSTTAQTEQVQPKGQQAESYEMVAAKANADAQIALIAASTATTQWDARDNAMAALRASMIAKQAADAAGEAYLRTQIEARASLDSVSAQAQAEMASRASQKAFLHAKAAADAASKAYAVSGGAGNPAVMGASQGVPQQ